MLLALLTTYNSRVWAPQLHNMQCSYIIPAQPSVVGYSMLKHTETGCSLCPIALSLQSYVCLLWKRLSGFGDNNLSTCLVTSNELLLPFS